MKKCSTCGLLYSGDLCPRCVASFAQQPSGPGDPQEEPPFKPGDVFHGLEIVELLGRGGMGVVYKARQPALDRHVALKILPRKMALDPDFQNRFIREAKALGALSHPNIVAVHDFGAENGLFFFAMEFVDGVNLRHVLRERKLTPEQAIKIVPQLCDALEYAHQEGVVHRDIKPENILIDKKGRVKIADFGLAKLVGADSEASTLTMTNMVMGTPHYMAPEQVENPKGVDHRADIYSMGVVFYEMLTGELPIGRFEPPSKKVQIDVRLDDVVLKTLEKHPERRYQKASEVKDDVSRVTTAGSVASYQPTVITPVPARKSRAPLALGAVAAAALLALVGFLVFRKEDPVARLRADAAAQMAAGNYKEAQGLYEAMRRVAASWADKAAAEKALEECREKLALPLDLTRYFVSENERVVPMGLVSPGGKLNRNPFYAKDPGEIANIVNWLGFQSLTPGDLRQGYLAVWFRAEVAYAVLDTAVAEQVEREFQDSKVFWNRWSYRKGNLLVLAFARERWDRHLLVSLVAAVRKKLGLPEEPLDVPLENLKFGRREMPSGMVLARETTAADGFTQEFGKAEGERIVQLSAALLPDLAAAQRREAEWAKDAAHLSALKVEVRRMGRTVAAVSCWKKDPYFFERVAESVRQSMGFPRRTWETILPAAAELPDGYSFDKIESDTAAVLGELNLKEVSPQDVKRGWKATLKPGGSIVLLEIPDFQTRSRAEDQLNKPVDGRDSAEDQDVWVYAVDAPDDPGLDALQNLVKGKFGSSPGSPRYVRLRHIRLEEKDLPTGYRLVRSGAPSDRHEQGELDGPSGKIAFSMKDYNDLKDIWKDQKTIRKQPSDVVLHKDFLLVHLSGPESAWAAMDELESMLRKKMRMDPPSAEDYAIAPGELPPGLAYLERSDLGLTRNPETTEHPTPEATTRWRAVVDPGGTHVTIFAALDAGKARDLEATIRRSLEGAKGVVLTRKNAIVALVQRFKGDEASFKAIAEVVRAKLRLPK